jgi:AraC family transcriptional regulator
MTTNQNPIAKAVWFIEAHLAQDITLADIAGVAAVSRFHLVRAFGVTNGWSVMRYVRARRLTEAARALAAGAPDILTVALDAGYGSHEAFTRSFRDQFGLTPERVRAGGTLGTLSLVEAINMDETTKTVLQPPRLQDGPAMLIAGPGGHFTFDNTAGIPALWQRFRDHPELVSKPVAYGVSVHTDANGGFDYVAGVEVADPAAIPAEFARARITPQRYAVFTHTGHVSAIRATYMAIFNDWLPGSGHAIADAPMLERHDQRFDSDSGMGSFEIWIPIAG